MTAASRAEGRLAWLEAAGFNTNLLPPESVEIDLLSDSWFERATRSARQAAPDGEAALDLPGRLAAIYGFPYNLPVARGRFAEALLAQALFRPGQWVASNTLFPTTRFHIAARGATWQDLSMALVRGLEDPHPFKGDLDLDALRPLLANGDVQAVYLELCSNGAGGQPISLANLRDVQSLTEAAGIPLILDGTRAWENAALIREREPGQQGRPLEQVLHDVCACATACAASLGKDYVTPVGAFVGTRAADLHHQLQDLAVLAYGHGLSSWEMAKISEALAIDHDGGSGATTRTSLAQRLHLALRSVGVPVVQPAGGHGVFVDAGAFLPHLPAEQHPIAALCNALYLAGGPRAGANPGLPNGAARVEPPLLRLAIPIGTTAREADAMLDRTVAAFQQIAADPGQVQGLRLRSRAPGLLGALTSRFEPI